MTRRVQTLAVSTLAFAALALTGCAQDEADKPVVTGAATNYDSLDELRDAFVAAGGSCDEWESVDPGEYDAVAGRCNNATVIAVYNNTEHMHEVIERSQGLAADTHLLVGENWIINTENPSQYVDALGGTTVYD